MPFSKLKLGWDYLFHVTPVLRDDAGPRAAFLAFQTYPANMVQGGGTLVTPRNSAPRSAFRETQAPQVIQTHSAIRTDLLGGGAHANTLIFQSLSDTSKALG